MCRCRWPGNARELQNVLRRVIILNEGEDVLDSMIAKNNFARAAKSSFRSDPLPDLLNLLGLAGEELNLNSLPFKKIGKRTSDFVEKQVISYVLDKTGWNRIHNPPTLMQPPSYAAGMFRLKLVARYHPVTVEPLQFPSR